MDNFKVEKGVIFASTLLAILILVASTIGVFSKEEGDIKEAISLRGDVVELYGVGVFKNESKALGFQFVAQDIMNLVVGLPMLIIGLTLYRKKSMKGYFILTGTIGYFAYTYASYSFGSNLNYLFLLYTSAMGLSLFCLIKLFAAVEVNGLDRYFKGNTPFKFYGILQIVLSILFIYIWLERIIPTFFGDYSASLIEHYTTLGIQALDLGIIIPVTFCSGVLILRKKSYGYLLTPVILFKLTTLFLVISNMVLIEHLGGIQQDLKESAIFLFIAVFILVSFILLLFNIRSHVEKRTK